VIWHDFAGELKTAPIVFDILTMSVFVATFTETHSGDQSVSEFTLPTSMTFPELVFTTMLLQKTTNTARETKCAIYRFSEHIERVKKHAQDINPPLYSPPSQFIRRCFLESLRRARQTRWFDSNILNNYLARIILKESHLLITLSPWKPLWCKDKAIDVTLFHGQRPLAAFKSCLTATSIAAREDAEKNKSGEALLVNEDGQITEGAWSNIFWVDPQDQLYTPPLESSLRGITQKAVMNLHPTQIASLHVTDLDTRVKEIFITQSTTGITPVVTVDGRPISTGSVPGKITTLIQKKYEKDLISQSTRFIITDLEVYSD
jgi:branched-subunit amino acid aminotransferase/4-amino-4-deoxychorismate lyase